MNVENHMLLKLPLCPKCGDTKHVEESNTQILIPTSTQYQCHQCQIRWWTSAGCGTVADMQWQAIQRIGR